MSNDDNATWLFQRPDRRFHNSESWWTALFSMVLLHLSTHTPVEKLPIKRFERRDRHWAFTPTDESLDPHGLTFSSVLVEAKLSGGMFAGVGWRTEFDHLRPDVTIYHPEQKRVRVLETKTIEAKLFPGFDRYLAIIAALRSGGWDADAVLLLSHGHEVRSELDEVGRRGVKLLLWEDVLRLELISQPASGPGGHRRGERNRRR